jgi:hypothetical protein
VFSFGAFGLASYVYFEALCAFLVYLEAHCAFLIYTTLLIKKKKKNEIHRQIGKGALDKVILPPLGKYIINHSQSMLYLLIKQNKIQVPYVLFIECI